VAIPFSFERDRVWAMHKAKPARRARSTIC
jgi:hypothetical protein